VARFNVEQSVRNAERLAESGLAGMLSNNREVSSKIEGPEGRAIRDRLATAIPAQREHFDYMGQTFGYAYHSPIIIDDGTPANPISVHEYFPTARPGHRAPHFLLDGPNGPMSAIDLFDYSAFTLLTGEDGRGCVAPFLKAASSLGVKGRALVIGSSGDFSVAHSDWLELYGITSSGAVLVRPDGHVAWRIASGSDVSLDALRSVLRRSLGFVMERAAPTESPGCVGDATAHRAKDPDMFFREAR
jgi:putative polyketide hydroxylase